MSVSFSGGTGFFSVRVAVFGLFFFMPGAQFQTTI
jgi:hypothetical protein